MLVIFDEYSEFNIYKDSFLDRKLDCVISKIEKD